MAAPHEGRVLHVTGRITDSVFSLLGPTTSALNDAGIEQVVLLLDALESAHHIVRFDDEVALVPVATTTPQWKHWLALRRKLRLVLAQEPPAAVHFHGLLPWLVGVGLLRGSATRVYLTPHGSLLLRLLWPLLKPTAALLRLGSRRPADVGVASSSFDFQHLKGLDLRPLLLEGAVDDALFDAERHEARRPLIVAGCHRDNRKAVELFCRMAVICSAAELDLAFNWFGPLDDASAARLKAAGVSSIPDTADAAVAERLGAAWVFVASGGERDFPVRLAEAMAAGIACLVADLPNYRGLVSDGESALVYRDAEHALQLLTRLIDDVELRGRLGRAAREAARRRFTRGRLSEGVEQLYAPQRRKPPTAPVADDAVERTA